MVSNSEKEILCYCMSGGELVTYPDGSVSYKGGITKGVKVDSNTKYSDFVRELCSKFEIDPNTVTLKYSTPFDKSRLLALSDQSDFANLLGFNQGFADVYVVKEERCVEPQETTRCSGDVLVGSVVEDSNLEEATNRSNDKAPLLSALWENAIKGVGQIFDSGSEFRNALANFSIACHFGYKYIRNDRERIIAQCVADGCQWKIYASAVGSSNIFRVRKYEDKHTHPTNYEETVKYRISKMWVSNIIKEKFRNNPDYTPQDVIKEIKRDYNVDIAYHQARRGKESVKEAVNLSLKNSFKLVPWICQRLVESNPGTVAVYTSKSDSTFHQLFIAYYASIHGFRVGCRPILFVEEKSLNGKYLHTLLSVTAVDADNRMFPVAFAVVESGSLENWRWFFRNVKVALDDNRDIIFVSERTGDIVKAVEEIYGSVPHARCYHHLTEGFKMMLKCLHLSPPVQDVLKMLLDKIAYAKTRLDFDDALGKMRSISEEAYDWVLKNEPVHWANSLFPGKRYDQFSVNIAGSYGAWIPEAQELSIIELINLICKNITDIMVGRQANCAAWKFPVGGTIEELLKKNISKSEGLHFRCSSAFRFEVFGILINYCVDLHQRTCSCREWDMVGLPCIHACAALKSIQADIYSYVEKCYLKETQQAIYSECIHAVWTNEIPDGTSVNGIEDDASSSGLGLLRPPSPPPGLRRLRGRPKKHMEPQNKEKNMEPQNKGKRPLHCSLCKEAGHNRKRLDDDRSWSRCQTFDAHADEAKRAR
ncbi:PREDICTED: uncharacterized protein LOC104610383 isoform X1 [Nelumbo nucifera]|uniref:Uncharacterized protein LOC104610383 isoform X1 n=1 Tax=Nelumbo nucifera TaxID=4432 RepID=A0A1U8Q9K4_NELNU|nr:PREDICTED: uncharacterized protein LOC104610383 isoform X1 [Nelumbo nucifera]XP_010275280.1 PREDICTED: uncharacterized protein LOC104610383 isoform X1 [Nelumbo nucifera]XP_019055478.1 PREDICTED: uncharacterized protein LOC104610383 isoform X1 [Nelumbo nucifera]